MHILVLSPYPPYPPYGGGTMRIYQLVRGLATQHQVTCLTFAPDHQAAQALAPLQACCRVLVVRGPPPRSLLRRAWTTLSSPKPDMALRNASYAYAELLHTLLATEHFDIIQAESIEMAGYLALLPKRPAAGGPARRGRAASVDLSGTTLVLDQFNAEHVLQQRAALTALQALRARPSSAGGLLKLAARAGYSLVQWRKLAHYERMVMRRCDLVLAVSDDDQSTLAERAAGVPVGVVPNGVDTRFFDRAAGPGRLSFAGPTLVFSGTLDFQPNIDALTWCVEAVLPLLRAQLPNLRLLIVGKRPAPAIRALARDPAIMLTGEVPDTRPYLASADVYLVPMRIGGGVRLKLLEALAMAAPVVSTRLGAEGVAGLHDGEHCLLADTPQAFAGAVLRLLQDRALAARLGQAGRTLAQQHYDWSVIVPRLAALYGARQPGSISVEESHER